MTKSDSDSYEAYTEQPDSSPHLTFSLAIHEQLGAGEMALGIMVVLTLLSREVRLIVQAFKKA